MEKFGQAHALLRAAGLPASAAPTAERIDLERVHAPAYLGKLATGGLSEGEEFRLGFKTSPALFARCRLETGGTVAALEAALVDGVAANLAGGTHHAFPGRASGFCLLNDVAVAIRRLHAGLPNLRVLVIDTDAHQGNGTHAIFREDGRVFTYSIHVEKNYPSIKEPGDLDVGLPRWVTGAVYLGRLAETLPPVFDGFDADLAVWISGADPHEDDRFGQMRLTTADLAERDRAVVTLCQRYEVPLAVLYGGGYNRVPGQTARLHTSTVLTVAQAYGRSGT